MKESKRLGAKTLAITNVVGSSIAREAHQVIHTWAGPEIAVASTKAYTTQLILMFMLALYMAQICETLTEEKIRELINLLKKIPAQISETLSDVEPIKTFARQYGFNEDVFYIGRALGELGYRRMRYGGVRGYIVVRRTGDEIDHVQKSMALEACPDG